jgi:hypothetical protein
MLPEHVMVTHLCSRLGMHSQVQHLSCKQQHSCMSCKQQHSCVSCKQQHSCVYSKQLVRELESVTVGRAQQCNRLQAALVLLATTASLRLAHMACVYFLCEKQKKVLEMRGQRCV